MPAMRRELNIDWFQGYGNSSCKKYHKAKGGMPQDIAGNVGG